MNVHSMIQNHLKAELPLQSNKKIRIILLVRMYHDKGDIAAQFHAYKDDIAAGKQAKS